MDWGPRKPFLPSWLRPRPVPKGKLPLTTASLSPSSTRGTRRGCLCIQAAGPFSALKLRVPLPGSNSEHDSQCLSAASWGTDPWAAYTPGPSKTWPLPTTDSTKQLRSNHLSGPLLLRTNLVKCPEGQACMQPQPLRFIYLWIYSLDLFRCISLTIFTCFFKFRINMSSLWRCQAL